MEIRNEVAKVIKNIKQEFSIYKIYYVILEFKDSNVTDIEVKKAYERKCKELNLLRGIEDCDGEKIEEIRQMIQETLDDAYRALETENSRSNYQEMLARNIKKEFTRYKTYYEILGLNNTNITDIEVKEAYNKKCAEIYSIIKYCKKEDIEEIKTIIQEALNDAYSALKDINSRRHYQDILDSIEGAER